MRRTAAYILLGVFTGFLVSISVDFSLYLKILNAGAAVEDVNSMPEEHNEKSVSDSKLKNHLTYEAWMLILAASSECEHFEGHRFSVVENLYFDVPYSPPEYGRVEESTSRC